MPVQACMASHGLASHKEQSSNHCWPPRHSSEGHKVSSIYGKDIQGVKIQITTNTCTEIQFLPDGILPVAPTLAKGASLAGKFLCSGWVPRMGANTSFGRWNRRPPSPVCWWSIPARLLCQDARISAVPLCGLMLEMSPPSARVVLVKRVLRFDPFDPDFMSASSKSRSSWSLLLGRQMVATDALGVSTRTVYKSCSVSSSSPGGVNTSKRPCFGRLRMPKQRNILALMNLHPPRIVTTSLLTSSKSRSRGWQRPLGSVRVYTEINLFKWFAFGLHSRPRSAVAEELREESSGYRFTKWMGVEVLSLFDEITGLCYSIGKSAKKKYNLITTWSRAIGNAHVTLLTSCRPLYGQNCLVVFGSFWDKTQFCTLVCSSVVSSFTLLIFIDFIVMIYCTTLVYIVETVSSRIINYWFNYGNLNSQNIRKFKVHFVTSKTLFSKNVAHS